MIDGVSGFLEQHDEGVASSPKCNPVYGTSANREHRWISEDNIRQEATFRLKMLGLAEKVAGSNLFFNRGIAISRST